MARLSNRADRATSRYFERVSSSGCVNQHKVMYRTKTQARNMAAVRSKETGQSLRFYKCPGCGFYHLSSARR